MRDRIVIQSSLNAYLHRAARNRAVDMLQRIAADRDLRDHVIRQIEDQLEGDLSRAARLERWGALLEQSMAAMPAQRRRVFEMVRLKGLSYEEAADQLGISRNTVKEHLAKALQFLRKDLIDKGDLVILLFVLQTLF